MIEILVVPSEGVLEGLKSGSCKSILGRINGREFAISSFHWKIYEEFDPSV
jgi:hypothetical protein